MHRSPISDAISEHLDRSLRGRVIRPSDSEYEASRKVYNAMIDKRPAAIVRCADVADVISAVDFARESELTLAIRGGGHNGAGLGTCDGGLVMDLSRLDGILLDPRRTVVRVEGGATWGSVDHATHAIGMAVPSGIISTTGVGGLSLGGGLGYLTRRFGLTIDNMLGADVVLADGTFVRADATSHPDLFWAIRGGGGNFGAVTAFEFRLNPVRNVVAGPMLWDLDDTPEVMRWFADTMPTAPRDLNGFFAVLQVPPADPFPEEIHLRTVGAVVWCWTGDPDQADDALAAARAVRPPLFEAVQELPYPVLQRMFDALYPPGHLWYWRADYVKDVPDEAIALHIEHARRIPTVQSTMHLYPVSGAAHDAASSDTAWGHRDANFVQVTVGVDPDPAKADELRTFAVEYWEDLHPYSAGGAYVNFLMDEGSERVRATYGENYARLQEIKSRYDPTNLFRVNQNIPPSS